MASIYPLTSYFLKMGLFLTLTASLASPLHAWGEMIFYLNLFFSIMSSKSMSTFLPEAML